MDVDISDMENVRHDLISAAIIFLPILTYIQAKFEKTTKQKLKLA